MNEIIPQEIIESRIYVIRGKKVMLDTDLATLYRVTTKRFNEQVKRNLKRFPSDFMFQLNVEENQALRSQFATLKQGRGQHRKYFPHVFTEQGIAMLSGILNSDRAIQVNIAVMRAFVNLREMIASNKDLTRRLDVLEKKYDAQFRIVFDAIRAIMSPPQKKRPLIGFKREEE